MSATMPKMQIFNCVVIEKQLKTLDFWAHAPIWKVMTPKIEAPESNIRELISEMSDPIDMRSFLHQSRWYAP